MDISIVLLNLTAVSLRGLRVVYVHILGPATFGVVGATVGVLGAATGGG